MEVYFGGAYNGKLKYVCEKYNLKSEEVYYCDEEILDFNKKVICGLHILVLKRVKNKKESLEYIKSNINLLKNKIIICDDISCGVVPINKEQRIFREELGQIMQFLTKESDRVTKVFYGIPKVLKGE